MSLMLLVGETLEGMTETCETLGDTTNMHRTCRVVSHGVLADERSSNRTWFLWQVMKYRQAQGHSESSLGRGRGGGFGGFKLDITKMLLHHRQLPAANSLT